MQGGMIGKTQIVAKPDDAGSGLANHRIVNSEVRRGIRMAAALQLWAG
jgi:hypothetical protein